MAIKKFTPQNSDLFLGKDQGDHTLGKFGHLNYLLNLINSVKEPALSTSDTVIFTEPTIYGDPNTPLTGSFIYNDDTGAKLGVVQKMYHQSGVAPTFVGMTRIGIGTYSTTDLNIIYFEWNGSYVEYWITQ